MAVTGPVCNLCGALAVGTSFNGFGQPVARCADCLPPARKRGHWGNESVRCPRCRGAGVIVRTVWIDDDEAVRVPLYEGTPVRDETERE